MEISRTLLFFFSALGAFNGVLMGLYFLFIAKPKDLSNRFLGALLIAMSIRIGKSVFFYFIPDLSYHYLQFGLSACLFIGPFLYFYIKSVLDPEGHIRKSWLYHMGILIPLIVILGIIYPFKTNIDLWRPYFIKGIYLIWLAYAIIAGYELRSVLKKIISKGAKMTSLEIWMSSIFIGNILIWAAYYYSGIMSYILGALLFSFMLYLLILLFVFHRKQDSVLLKKQKKYKNKTIANADALLTKLKEVMESKELYKNPNIKLPDVAKELNVLPHTVSQLLNDNVGQGFPSFLNQYRIEAAKSMLQTNTNFTLEGIGYDCGFNSKSTFFSAFKKFTGMTPAKFRDSLNT